MKLGPDSSVRLFNPGNAYWATGTNHVFTVGGSEEFDGWRKEQMSWKESCYIGDWTPCLDDLYVSGDDAEAFLKGLITNSFEGFVYGKAKHYVMCNEAGKVMAEGIIMRTRDGGFVLQSNTAYCLYQFYNRGDKYPDCTCRQPEYYWFDAYGSGNTCDRFKFQVSGPNALALCEEVAGCDLKDVKFMNFVEVVIDGVECIAIRQGMAGEPGFEIQGPIAEHDHIHQFIFDAGERYEIRRLGFRTAMINHLEACFPTYAFHYYAPQDEAYDDATAEAGFNPYFPVKGSFEGEWDCLAHSPFEMGWGMCVKFDHDFVGRAALEAEKDNVRQTVVTLEFDPQDLVECYASLFQTEEEPFEVMDMPMRDTCHVQADVIYDEDGKRIGIATTPGYSYYFRRVLSLSFVNVEDAQIGKKVKVLWGDAGHRQRLIGATICPAPYKKDNRRVDLHAI